MEIIFVKKIKMDGTPCRKCQDVEDRLERDGLREHIHSVLVADERNPTGPVWEMIRKNHIERAPFFVVHHQERENFFITYFSFKKFLREAGRLSNDGIAAPAAVDEDTPDDLYLI